LHYDWAGRNSWDRQTKPKAKNNKCKARKDAHKGRERAIGHGQTPFLKHTSQIWDYPGETENFQINPGRHKIVLFNNDKHGSFPLAAKSGGDRLGRAKFGQSNAKGTL